MSPCREDRVQPAGCPGACPQPGPNPAASLVQADVGHLAVLQELAEEAAHGAVQLVIFLHHQHCRQAGRQAGRWGGSRGAAALLDFGHASTGGQAAQVPPLWHRQSRSAQKCRCSKGEGRMVSRGRPSIGGRKCRQAGKRAGRQAGRRAGGQAGRPHATRAPGAGAPAARRARGCAAAAAPPPYSPSRTAPAQQQSGVVGVDLGETEPPPPYKAAWRSSRAVTQPNPTRPKLRPAQQQPGQPPLCIPRNPAPGSAARRGCAGCTGPAPPGGGTWICPRRAGRAGRAPAGGAAPAAPGGRRWRR